MSEDQKIHLKFQVQQKRCKTMVFIVKDQPHRVTCFFTRRRPPLGRTHVLPSSLMAVQAPRLGIRISLGPRPRGWLRNPSFPWQPLGKTLLSLLNSWWVTERVSACCCSTATSRQYERL